MSKVEMTVGQIMELGLWDNVCKYKGWNPYILNEGLVAKDEIVEFDTTFEKEPEMVNATIKSRNEIIEILNIAQQLLPEENEVVDELEEIIKQLEEEWKGEFADEII